MSRSEYYEQMKKLAREIRANYILTTPRVMKSDLRRIYKDLGIRIDLWPHKLKGVRGAYFNDDDGVSVLLARYLPDAPMIFTMAHELKHHLVDRDTQRAIVCDKSNENEHIEIGAEIFAAELIFPEQLFIDTMSDMEIKAGQCKPEDIIHVKKSTDTTLSYTGLVKRATHLKFAESEALKGIQWLKLEEQIYGEPIYKKVQRARKRRLS